MNNNEEKVKFKKLKNFLALPFSPIKQTKEDFNKNKENIKSFFSFFKRKPKTYKDFNSAIKELKLTKEEIENRVKIHEAMKKTSKYLSIAIIAMMLIFGKDFFHYLSFISVLCITFAMYIKHDIFVMQIKFKELISLKNYIQIKRRQYEI